MGKKSRTKAANLILSVLTSDAGSRTETELCRAVQDQDDTIKKSSIRKAIVDLLKTRQIFQKDEEQKSFQLSTTTKTTTTMVNACSDSKNENENAIVLSPHGSNESHEDGVKQEASPPSSSTIPIAIRLRQHNSNSSTTRKSDDDNPNNNKRIKSSVRFQEQEDENVDIDDEIARLERELAQYDDDDADGDDDDSDYNEQSHTQSVVQDNPQPTILSLSKFSDDRVEHLPEEALPIPGRYHPNNNTDSGTTKKKKSQKRKREPSSTTEETEPPGKKMDGLQQAVKEVLEGYQARSSERLPFYCRYCAHQFDNENDFTQHKTTDFHRTAVATERKLTYCKLCRLQLTSPVQMKEHLTSRPHQQRLQYMKAKNQGGGQFRSNGSNSGFTNPNHTNRQLQPQRQQQRQPASSFRR
ncbi:zinc-finger double-stranded RNA-binding protein [Nitzschia inconspicua]|uniref:Zinc-finger double-stranded RNA-binding protein n=1 Tax=Nitzschia inconspicua TaxID=303405 RepID=A0A9K3KHA1_9STRA|nr:zinc-finger double-stranded RNA-binding protein [Nitzschia inconspicua]